MGGGRPSAGAFRLQSMDTSTKAPIVVVGAGYVGLVTAVGFARVRDVRVVDKNEALIERLRAGNLDISEPGLQQRFEQYGKRLSFHSTLAAALINDRRQLVFVAVGTPSENRGDAFSPDRMGEAANLESVEAIVVALAGRSKTAVVMKSTVPPGTGDRLLATARESGQEFLYLSCPEFLQEGNAFASLDYPDRIVLGQESHSWATDELLALHAELHIATHTVALAVEPLIMDITGAELVKHASNLHLAMRISYANHIANLSEELRTDVDPVLKAVGMDSRIGDKFLTPGLGFGGSCFEKDIRALRFFASTRNVDTSLATCVLSINQAQVDRVVAKLERHLGSLTDAQIALLGIAFKPGTDDIRGSRALALARRLRDSGATVRAWDPEEGARKRAVDDDPSDCHSIPLDPKEMASSVDDAVKAADAVVLVTEWPSFESLSWDKIAQAMRGDLVIDGRNQLLPAEVRAAGLEYEGTGRESRGLYQPLAEVEAEV